MLRKHLRRPSVTEQMLASDPQRTGEKSLPKQLLTDYLIPLGSILIAALALLAQYTQLPGPVVTVAVSYLVVVAGVSLYVPLARLLSFLTGKRKARRLATRYFPKLSESVATLAQLIARGNANTLLYVLEEVARWDELKNQPPLVDQEHIETMRSWLSAIERHIGRNNPKDFAILCSELGELVHQYNRLCYQQQRALESMISAGRFPDQRLRHLKQQWNVRREGHAEFVRGWASLSATINAMAGTRLCMDYYEPLPTLE